MSFRKQLAPDGAIQTLRNDTNVPSYCLLPRCAQVNFLRDILQIFVEEPLTVIGQGDTSSQRKIFLCHLLSASNEQTCTSQILSSLARQAYRRPISKQDIDRLIGGYHAARKDADFERGIAPVIEAILVSPVFLFLVERKPLIVQASLLTVISYASHTSVVKRGQWILDQLVGTTRATRCAGVRWCTRR
jgi:hypothetical protein